MALPANIFPLALLAEEQVQEELVPDRALVVLLLLHVDVRTIHKHNVVDLAASGQ